MPASDWRRKADEIERASSAQNATIADAHKAELDRRSQIEQVAKELIEFLNSDDGSAAKRLLAATGKHITLYSEREGGYASTYYIDKDGLCSEDAPAGDWTAYADKVPKPVVKVVSDDKVQWVVSDALRYLVSGEKPLEPGELLPYIKQLLDGIAGVTTEAK